MVLSCSASRWVAAEEHRSDESHAEPRQSTRDSGHHEGVIKRNDQGEEGSKSLIGMSSLHCYRKKTKRLSFYNSVICVQFKDF